MKTEKCPQCGSLECGPKVCRFSGESHAMHQERQAALAMIQRTIEAGGYLCECPGWWGCTVRGCYEEAKANHSGPARRPMPGDPNYLNSSSRSEDRINDSVYHGGTPQKRGM